MLIPRRTLRVRPDDDADLLSSRANGAADGAHHAVRRPLACMGATRILQPEKIKDVFKHEKRGRKTSPASHNVALR